MRPEWTKAEALAALDYCRRNLLVQYTYLEEDKKRNPLSDHAYSKWKIQEARKDLRAAEKRVEHYELKIVSARR